MKSNTVVRINNKLMNKGISFKEGTSFEDVLQAWSFLSCFILDVIEGKNEDYLIENSTEKSREKHKKHFIRLLEEWRAAAKCRSALSEILEIPDE